VVTTLDGGVRYIARDGVNCLSAPVGDAAGLTAAIGELLMRPELAARWRSLLGSAAKISSYPKKGIHI
jgi:glycosyltransferase involved in cell wall biosynthesis